MVWAMRTGRNGAGRARLWRLLVSSGRPAEGLSWESMPPWCRLPAAWDHRGGFSATSMGPPGCQLWDHPAWGAGLRKVAEQAGVDRKTARRYVAAAAEAGLARDGGPGQLTDELVGQVAEAG